MPATPTALLFPGQGSQHDGMEALVAARAPQLYEAALELVGANPFELAGTSTSCAQPAIFCASLAAWIAAGKPEADYFAGHSLGDLTALTAAGCFELEDGLRLAVHRGRLMEQAAAGSGGGMLAVIGDRGAAREVATSCGVVIANENAPDQLVLSGDEPALAASAALARRRGLKTIGLRVAGAFHSQSIASAVDPFRELVASTPCSSPRVPVISCSTAEPFAEPLAGELAAALTRPVRWHQVLLALASRGISRFVDVGPGRALRGLVGRTIPDAESFTIEELTGLAG